MAVQVRDTRAVVDHHLQALGSGQLDEIVRDYAENALLIVPDAAIKGPAAIRTAFQGYLAGIFKPGTYQFTMDTLRVEGDVAYAVWHAECADADIVFGTDTFVVRDGHIQIQTFAAKIQPH